MTSLCISSNPITLVKTILDEVAFSKFQESDFHVEPNLTCKLVTVLQLIVEYQVPIFLCMRMCVDKHEIIFGYLFDLKSCPR